jgi:hypothetical protein
MYGQLSTDRPGLSGALSPRAEAQVVRLACIYALLDMSATIRVEHLRAGLALWDYCERSVRYIFGDSLGDPIADEILQELRASPKGLTRDEIRQLVGKNTASERIGRALGVLVEYKLAAVQRKRLSAAPWSVGLQSSAMGEKGDKGEKGGSEGAFLPFLPFLPLRLALTQTSGRSCREGSKESAYAE